MLEVNNFTGNLKIVLKNCIVSVKQIKLEHVFILNNMPVWHSLQYNYPIQCLLYQSAEVTPLYDFIPICTDCLFDYVFALLHAFLWRYILVLSV